MQTFSKSGPTCISYSKVTSGFLIKYTTSHPHPASGRAHNVGCQLFAEESFLCALMAEKSDKKTKVHRRCAQCSEWASSDRFVIRHTHTKEVEANWVAPSLFMRAAVKLPWMTHWRSTLSGEATFHCVRISPGWFYLLTIAKIWLSKQAFTVTVAVVAISGAERRGIPSRKKLGKAA